MGDDRRAAEATERLLRLFDPSEPSAIDLRMGIASFLSTDPQTLPRAIEHARMVLKARGDDPRAIQLMADLLQRADRRAEAAQLLDRLAARERNRDRLHDIYLRKAKLLAEVPGAETTALEAVERAAAINPGNRETISLLVDQLNRTGQSARVASYLQPIRSALVSNVGRGAVSLRDLGLLATVSRRAQPELARMASDLLQAMEPSPTTASSDPTRAPTKVGFRKVLDTAAVRVTLYSSGEPPLLHSLLQALDGVVGRLSREFPMVNNTDAVPMPSGADVSRLTAFAKRCAALVGVPAPKLGATRLAGHRRLPQRPLAHPAAGGRAVEPGRSDRARGPGRHGPRPAGPGRPASPRPVADGHGPAARRGLRGGRGVQPHDRRSRSASPQGAGLAP